MENKRIIKSTLKSSNGGILQINDVFKKRAIEGIFEFWLKEYNINDGRTYFVNDWCNRISSKGIDYEMTVEVKLVNDKIENIFIGHEKGYDESGTNYSWQIKLSWLSKRFINNVDENLNLNGKFIEFINEHWGSGYPLDDENDRIKIRFSIPSFKNLYPDLN